MMMVRKIIQAIPLKLTIIIIALSLWINEEWYPFSTFPMYSEHHSETALIIIADAEGKPIPVLNEFGISTVEINKVFQTNFSALNDGQGFWTALSEKEKAIAVKVALDLTYYLKGNRHPKVENPKNYRQLQFWYYHFYINEEDKASTDKELIAVHPFPMD